MEVRKRLDSKLDRPITWVKTKQARVPGSSNRRATPRLGVEELNIQGAQNLGTTTTIIFYSLFLSLYPFKSPSS